MNSIKEVLAFPFMKDDGTTRKLAAEVVDVKPINEEGIRQLMMAQRRG